MDRVKAIKVLKPLVDSYVDYANISTKEEDDNIVEALEMAIEALDVPDTNVGDMISRQMAIDIERNATVDTNPSHFEAHQKFTQFMDDAEVSSFGRWQWSNGFNTALTAVGIDLEKLPSAQPDHIADVSKKEDMMHEYIYKIVKDCDGVYCYIKQGEMIRCKDCKHWDTEWSVAKSRAHYCPIMDGNFHCDFYCAYAERRTDG